MRTITAQSIYIDPPLRGKIEKALQQLKEKRPDVLKPVEAIYALHSGNFGEWRSDDPNAVYINIDLIQQRIRQMMEQGLTNEQASNEAIEGAIEQAVNKQLAMTMGHESEHARTQGEGGEAPAEVMEQQLQQQLAILKQRREKRGGELDEEFGWDFTEEQLKEIAEISRDLRQYVKAKALTPKEIDLLLKYIDKIAKGEEFYGILLPRSTAQEIQKKIQNVIEMVEEEQGVEAEAYDVLREAFRWEMTPSDPIPEQIGKRRKRKKFKFAHISRKRGEKMLNEEEKRVLFDDKNVAIAIRMAKNPYTKPEVLAVLAKHPNIEVIRALASNKSILLSENKKRKPRKELSPEEKKRKEDEKYEKEIQTRRRRLRKREFERQRNYKTMGDFYGWEDEKDEFDNEKQDWIDYMEAKEQRAELRRRRSVRAVLRRIL